MSKSNLEAKANILASNIEGWEVRTLERIGNRIKRTGQLSKYDKKALDNMANIGVDLEEIYKDLARVTELNISEVQKMYEKEMTEQVQRNQALYKAKGVPFIPYSDNPYAQQLVKNWAAQTAGEMVNLARSKVTGFKVNGGKTFAPIDKAYQSAMDKAVVAVRTGTTDFYTAMRDTMNELGGGVVNYDSGVVRQLDTLVRSNILYGAKQSAQQYQKYIGEQFGADGCEIDYHPHPRPSHAPMGGVMFTYEKEPKTINGVTYPSFYKPYKGEKSPEDLLNEYGCLHFATDVILGLSEPNWDKKELERRKAEDKELIEYTVKKQNRDGTIEEKTLYKTRYEWSQKQRELERMAREEKRQAHFSKACGNNIKARQHEENLQQIKTAYNDLCEKTGLTPTPERMAVYKSANAIDFGRKSGIIKERSAKPITKITDEAINKVPKVKINGYSDEQCTYIQNQHKELLKYARDKNNNNEVAFVYKRDLTNRQIIQGNTETADVTEAIVGKGSGVVVLHNHPRNSSYSDRDIKLLLKNEDVSVITIIKNNGSIETLQKSSNYNQKTAKTELKRKMKKYVKNNTDEEMDIAIREFIKSNKGMLIWQVI